MRLFILAPLFAFILSSTPSFANEILMNEVSATSIQSDHAAAFIFWEDEQRFQKHPFFEEASGDRLALKELNLRAIQIWRTLILCANTENGDVIARSLLHIEQTCPEAKSTIDELNRNYIEFLGSAGFSPHIAVLDTSRKFGRVPLHPLLNQFSFNYYIQIISAMSFEEGLLNGHHLHQVLGMDLSTLISDRNQKRAAEEKADADWRAYTNASTFWERYRTGKKAIEALNNPNLSINRSGLRIERLEKYYALVRENRKYLEAYDNFLVNNFILMIQNMIHQFPGPRCTGVGIYEYSNLTGILQRRLVHKHKTSYAVEEHFRNMLLNSCNERTHFKMTNWQQAWRTEGSDPLPEALELSKFHRKFPL